MKTTNLSSSDKQLIAEAKNHIEANYKKNKHHVACLIRQNHKVYKSLHLDSGGVDVCAEPLALSQALAENSNDPLETIVSAIKRAGKTKIINPCGNCRQILYEYAPNIHVIISHNKTLKKIKAKDLLPFPYQGPLSS